ncbi:MAG: hypothetical protein JWO46_1161 [Nocardioidaceae bacterium]|nr:hypothetical protein [Nocardioidaceae bacterium]
MRQGLEETRHDALLEVLWPAATRTERSPQPLLGDYTGFPDADAPQFLLPRDRRAADGVLTHFRSDGRVGRRALVALMRTTGGWPFGRRVRVGGPDADATIEAHLRDVLGVDVFLGIQLGPQRANRKPILQVLGADRLPLAFGKLGVDPLTRGLVHSEADALRRLAGHDLPGIRLPALLHADRWGEHELLLTTPLPMGEAERPVPGARRVEAMVTVTRALGTRQLAPAASGWLTRHRVQATALPAGPLRERLLGAVEVLAAVPDAWEVGCWHGDWVDSNTAVHGGDVLLWDWERFDPAVPVGWDALHHALGEGPRRASVLLDDAPGLLAPFDVPSDRARSVAVGYLVELALRHAGDDQRGAAGSAARVEDWLLPVLPGSP